MVEDKNSERPVDQLSEQERVILLRLAREALESGVRGEPLPNLDIKTLTPKLIQPGATFVTLTKNQELRGCIGTLEASKPLAEDVRVHAVAAALEDYRFPRVQEHELPIISIEISRLTIPVMIDSREPGKVISQIRPGLDGVVLRKGIRRATFLPQVWDKVPELEIFLGMLCRKMGADQDCWRRDDIEIYTYQVEKFCE